MKTVPIAWGIAATCLLALGVAGCSKGSPEEKKGTVRMELSDTASKAALRPSLNRIWKRSDGAYGAAAGSIYIFLQDGTLLETSCVETYRVATWSIDPGKPDTLRVLEDGRLAFTATLGDVSGNTLHMRQMLLQEKDPRDVALTAVEGEFVCPDLKK